MILVDIYVLAVGSRYDFQLDENVPVCTVIEEVSELIGQKEHCHIAGDISKLMLCSEKSHQILYGSYSLEECDILTGDSLFLV